MSDLAARALEHVHGHLGWLAALALAHPAVLLRKPRRRALGVAAAATALVSAAALLGAIIYPRYRVEVKPLLLAGAPVVAGLFERKEHLGVGALVLSWAGLVAHACAQRDRIASPDLGRVAFVAYVAAAVCATLAAAGGLVVAAHRCLGCGS